MRLAIVFAGCFALAFFVGSLAFIPRQSSATLTLDVAAEPSLASSLDPANLELVLNPTPLGTQVVGELTATVSTDNVTGYKLTVQTNTNNAALVHANGVDTVDMITSATPVVLTNNTWGFNVGAGATTFRAMPVDGETPYVLKETASPGAGDASVVTIGARADTSIPAGRYMGTVVFSATVNFVPPHKPTVGSISPATNMTGGDIYVTGSGFFGRGAESAVTSVTVGGTPCASYVVTSDTAMRCVLPYKTTNASFAVVVTTEIPSTDSVNVTYDGANKGTMQAFTPTMCGAMATGLAQIRTDSRDSQTYRVKKMVDGKCWMIDNLRYGGFGTRVTGGYMVSSGTPAADSIQNPLPTWNISAYVDPSTAPTAVDYCIDTNNDLAGSTTKCGYLYNWYTATYGTGLHSTLSNGVAGSICPNTTAAGLAISTPWRLPTGNNNVSVSGDFGMLDYAMGGTGLTQTGVEVGVRLPATWLFSGSWAGVLAGAWSNGMAAPGGQGFYRTASAVDATFPGVSNQLVFSTTSVYPGAGVPAPKYNGMAIRCVMTP